MENWHFVLSEEPVDTIKLFVMVIFELYMNKV